MIPTIGLIVGVYILLRCVELLCASNTRFSGMTARAVVSVAAILTMLLTGFLMVDLFLGSASLSLQSLVPDAESSQRAGEELKPSAPPPKRTPEEEQRYRQELKDLIRRTRESNK